MPDHRVPHNFDAKDVCKWCNKTRVYHESGIATPYCENAPEHLVKEWRAKQAKDVANYESMQRAFKQGRSFA